MRVGRPVDQDEGRIVLKSSTLVGENGGSEPTQRLRGGQCREFGPLSEVDQSILAEELAMRVAGFDDAVGVEQQPVTRLELFVPDSRAGPTAPPCTPSGVRGGCASSLTDRRRARSRGGGCPASRYCSTPVAVSRLASTAVTNRAGPTFRSEQFVGVRGEGDEIGDTLSAGQSDGGDRQ